MKVISIDPKGKIGLSIKQLEEAPVKPMRMPRMAVKAENHVPRPAGPVSFEDKLSRFMKESDDRLLDLKRNTESKRGGRGASRER